MKHFLASALILLAAFLPLAGQNNPYEIDDTCYQYYQQAEHSLSDTGSKTTLGQEKPGILSGFWVCQIGRFLQSAGLQYFPELTGYRSTQLNLENIVA